MIGLWIFLGFCVLLLLAGYLVFRIACVRGHEYPWEDNEAMQKKIGPSYAALIRDGVDWLHAHNPRDVYLDSYDGLKLHARWIPAKEARGTIILFHGWRSSIVGDFSPILPVYHAWRFNLLLVDQRSHNGSTGRYITFGIRESRDVAPWVEFHNREFGDFPVFLGGISMGATTILMASGGFLPANVRGLVADCGFSSPWDIMKEVGRTRAHLPPFPILYLANFWCRLAAGFDAREDSTLRAMKSNRLPILFIHGQADHFVPCTMTQAAYEAAMCEKELILVPGAAHGRSYLVDGPRCRAALERFLERNLPEKMKEVHTCELRDH